MSNQGNIAPHSEPIAQLLVVGASFAGLEILYQLEARGYWRQNPPPQVCVVDQCDGAPYLPLIHEELVDRASNHASIPFARYFDALAHVRFVKAKAIRIDVAAREVQLAGGQVLKGEKLVVAVGSQLRVPAAIDPQGRCLVLKSLADLQRLKARLDLVGEEQKTKAPPRVVVIGGGLTGVELAGELAHRPPRPLAVTLIHAQATLLPSLAPRAGRLAKAQLKALGVEVLLETRVQRVDGESIEVIDAQGARRQIPAELVCWAGGVVGPSDIEWSGAQLVGPGWLGVDPHLRIWSSQGEAHEKSFAIGDVAAISSEAGQTPWPVMRRAIEAIWQAKTLGAILAQSKPDPSPHALQLHWPYGVSIGPASLLCYRGWAINLGALGRWFRRWLGAMYRRRYGLHTGRG